MPLSSEFFIAIEARLTSVQRLTVPCWRTLRNKKTQAILCTGLNSFCFSTARTVQSQNCGDSISAPSLDGRCGQLLQLRKHIASRCLRLGLGLRFAGLLLNLPILAIVAVDLTISTACWLSTLFITIDSTEVNLVFFSCERSSSWAEAVSPLPAGCCFCPR